MNILRLFLLSGILFVLLAGCKSMNKTQKGAAIGAGTGAVVGAVVGKAAGNTALGAIIGGAVGGTAGAVIGREMDKQAEEIKKEVPAAKVERVGEGIVIEFDSKVLFGFDRSDISNPARKSLDDLTRVLQKYPDTDIEIQGHTDDRGSQDYNANLSEKRAMAVSAYLENRGVNRSRILTVGYGEEAPKYSNDTDDGRSQNRRVDFVITANEKMKKEAAVAKEEG
jgi:outer membrane protein OmpA-like peptidoglycan-associated protein